MGKSRTLILIFIGVVLITIIYLAFRSYRPVTSTQTPSPSPAVENTKTLPTKDSVIAPTVNESSKNTVEVNSDGFSPASITIKAGQAVTWINKDKSSHQVSSDPHPTHTDYPQLNSAGLLTSGESKTLTFPKNGTFKYHDHLNPEFTGEIIVE